jgi:2-methylcitrate dehydratase
MQKIRVVELDDFLGWYPKAMPTRVTVRTGSGTEYVKQVDYPLGHPRNPLSDGEVERKFRGLTARLFDRARAGKVIETVWQLEKLEDIGALMPLLKVRAG